MTHVPEIPRHTSAIQKIQSASDFWPVHHANPVPVLSGTGLRHWLQHCSIPRQKLAC